MVFVVLAVSSFVVVFLRTDASHLSGGHAREVGIGLLIDLSILKILLDCSDSHCKVHTGLIQVDLANMGRHHS